MRNIFGKTTFASKYACTTVLKSSALSRSLSFFASFEGSQGSAILGTSDGLGVGIGLLTSFAVGMLGSSRSLSRLRSNEDDSTSPSARAIMA